MELTIKGKNLEVPQVIRSYVERKIGRLGRHLDNILEAMVELSKEQTRSQEHRHVVQVTIHLNGAILRGEEKASDLHAAIDSVADVMDRQIARYKGKLYEKHKANAARRQAEAAVSLATGSAVSPGETGGSPRLVKTKRFAVKPMFPDEAAEQMELLGHDFFVFFNAASEQVNVLYRRKDGNYGLIEPELT